MPEQADENDALRATVPPHPTPAEPPVGDAGHVFRLNLSAGGPKPLPTDALSPEVVERMRSGEALSADDLAGDPNVVVVPGIDKKFEWHWKGTDQAPDTETEPATYYEALTGRPDPMREFFVTSRRLLNVVTWVIALGIPLGLVIVGVVRGESPETIFFMGVAGLVVGMMLKYSIPRTPFG